MLKVDNLSVRAGNFHLKNISFQTEQGEYIVLAGPSGSGKTILLETLAGHRKPENGKILLDGQNLIPHSADKRPFTLLFQELALFPHLNVAENIGYAIKEKNKQAIIKDLAGQFSIQQHLNKKIQHLSGGEQQRVALARALATKPEILLLDEPLSSLDKPIKNDLIQILLRLNQKGQTIIHVTHDVHEALNLADKTGILQQGELTHFCNARELIQNPGDYFTASFLDYENIIPLDELDIPAQYNPSDYAYIAFDSKMIEPGKQNGKIRITGRLIQRPSGQLWLESPYGLLKMKALGNTAIENNQRLTINIDYENVLFLKA